MNKFIKDLDILKLRKLLPYLAQYFPDILFLSEIN